MITALAFIMNSYTNRRLFVIAATLTSVMIILHVLLYAAMFSWAIAMPRLRRFDNSVKWWGMP